MINLKIKKIKKLIQENRVCLSKEHILKGLIWELSNSEVAWPEVSLKPSDQLADICLLPGLSRHWGIWRRCCGPPAHHPPLCHVTSG